MKNILIFLFHSIPSFQIRTKIQPKEKLKLATSLDILPLKAYILVQKWILGTSNIIQKWLSKMDTIFSNNLS